MQPSTTAFVTALSQGAKMASRVAVYLGDKIKEDTYYNGSGLNLITQNSSVSYSRLDDTRMTADISFVVRDLSYLDYIDPTAFPELYIYSGVVINGVPEWIDMGVCGIADLELTRTGDTVYARCTTADRSGRIRDNAWKAPFQVAASTDYYLAMKNIVADRARGFTPSYNIASLASPTTPSMTFSEQDDPWAAVLKLAEAAGAEAYFDRQGAFNAFPVTDPLLTAPSLLLQPDTAGILITPVGRQWGNRDVYNGVICRGEAPWLLFPVSGEIWNEDPTSPGYRYGPFGEKPKVIGDALSTTDAQCLAAATAEFKRISGVIENISFNTIKDPRLEVGDVIDQLDDLLQITGRYVLDTYVYPLGSGPAQGTVRRKR